MEKYLAFLRAVNVGGHNKIKKQDQIELFEKFGAKNVDAYLATGNILFNYDGSLVDLQSQVETELGNLFDSDMPVMIRTFDQVKAVVDSQPFPAGKPGKDQRWYVTILHDEMEMDLPSTYTNSSAEVEYFFQKNGIILSILTVKKGGVSPNSYIEKELDTPATSRGWSTFTKLVDRWS